MLRWNGLIVFLTLGCGAALSQSLNCDLQGYKPQDGLKAEMRGGALEFSWHGERGQQLRAAVHHPRRSAPGSGIGGEKRMAASGSSWGMRSSRSSTSPAASGACRWRRLPNSSCSKSR